MRTRQGFVSNSSSTSFIVTNTTDQDLKLVDFVEENPQLVEQFRQEYDWHDPEEYNQLTMMLSATQENETIKPGDNQMVFGDEDGTVVGKVFDYILREGGTSSRFSWRFHEWRR